MIVAGLGFRSGSTAAQLAAALASALRALGHNDHELLGIGAPEFKRADKGLQALCVILEKPLWLFSLEALRAAPPTLTHSPAITQRYGVGSLSEACALLAAATQGKQARLLAPRAITGSVTCALAIFDAQT